MSLVPLQRLCHALSSGVNQKPLGSFFHLHTLSTARPGVQHHFRSKVRFGGQPSYPIQWIGLKDGATWELIRGLGYSGLSSPPCCSLSSANHLYRGFSQGMYEVGVPLFHTERSALSWLLEGVRVWKLSKTYPGEKPSSLSLPTQGCCFVKCKPTKHLLTIPNIPERMRALYERLMTHLPRDSAQNFLKIFKYSFYLRNNINFGWRKVYQQPKNDFKNCLKK